MTFSSMVPMKKNTNYMNALLPPNSLESHQFLEQATHYFATVFAVGLLGSVGYLITFQESKVCLGWKHWLFTQICKYLLGEWDWLNTLVSVSHSVSVPFAAMIFGGDPTWLCVCTYWILKEQYFLPNWEHHVIERMSRGDTVLFLISACLSPLLILASICFT